MSTVAEKMCYHALAASASHGYPALHALHTRHHSWEAAWAATHHGEDPRPLWRSVEACDASVMLLGDADFPPLLAHIPLPPFGLYVRGTLPTHRDAIAIVGTRKATEEGIALAEEFAAALAGAGLTIVSGLALGIDRAAHEGCMRVGGRTIAVLGTGIDAISPRANEATGARILAGAGAIVSEYPPGTATLPHHFLERNRIVSGISRAVLCIEVPENSGARATARFALEQNRDLFVLPGPARHPHFKGSHALIREGALLVTEPSQILEELGISRMPSLLPSSDESAVLTVLKAAAHPLDMDAIIESTNLHADAATQAVSSLLIKGIMRETPHGYAVA